MRLVALWLMWCAAISTLGICLAAALGCASTVHVATSSYELTAEVNTGTTIAVTRDLVLIERASVRETVAELPDVIGGALRAALGL